MAENSNDEQQQEEAPQIEPEVQVEEPEPATIKRGGEVRFVDFKYAYNKSDLAERQKTLLWPGVYDIVSHKDGLLHVRGRGRDAWVKSSASDIPIQ